MDDSDSEAGLAAILSGLHAAMLSGRRRKREKPVPETTEAQPPNTASAVFFLLYLRRVGGVLYCVCVWLYPKRRLLPPVTLYLAALLALLGSF